MALDFQTQRERVMKNPVQVLRVQAEDGSTTARARLTAEGAAGRPRDAKDESETDRSLNADFIFRY